MELKDHINYSFASMNQTGVLQTAIVDTETQYLILIAQYCILTETSAMPEHNCEVFDMYQEGKYFCVRCSVCYKPVLWCDLHTVGGGLGFQFLDISGTFDSRDAMYLTREEAKKLRQIAIPCVDPQ